VNYDDGNATEPTDAVITMTGQAIDIDQSTSNMGTPVDLDSYIPSITQDPDSSQDPGSSPADQGEAPLPAQLPQLNTTLLLPPPPPPPPPPSSHSNCNNSGKNSSSDRSPSPCGKPPASKEPPKLGNASGGKDVSSGTPAPPTPLPPLNAASFGYSPKTKYPTVKIEPAFSEEEIAALIESAKTGAAAQAPTEGEPLGVEAFQPTKILVDDDNDNNIKNPIDATTDALPMSISSSGSVDGMHQIAPPLGSSAVGGGRTAMVICRTLSIVSACLAAARCIV